MGTDVQRRLRTISIALAYCLLIFAVGGAVSRVLSLASVMPLMLLLLLYIAWRFPFAVAATACCVATLTLDFFYTEPLYALRISSPEDVAAMCCFLLVVLAISRLSGRLSEKTARLVERETAQLALHRLAERCLVLDWRESLAMELCSTVRECFGLEAVSLWDEAEGRFHSTAAGDESETVHAAFMAGQDYDLPNARQSIRLLRSGVRSVGSIQLQGRLPDASIIGSIATLVSLTLERARALSGEVQAQLEKSSEQLRSSVLDGLAHSIKTPLTTISVSSAGVMAMGGLTKPQTRLLHLVEGQAHFIAELTDRLLRTARLDTKVTAKRRQVDVAALTIAVVKEMDAANAPRVQLSGTRLPLAVSTDPELLRMAMLQVTENALKYSPPDSIVRIGLRQERQDVAIAIHNDGSYIRPEESKLVFKRFYRSPEMEQRAPGTGLGLSVARRAIEALGGAIAVMSDPASGTTFTITLPAEQECDARFDSYR
jgi:two-component system sensor histidine kinase KdpD